MLIAGGGTGGHLYPGIAVARELLTRVPDATATFVGTASGIESKVIPREGFTLDVIRSRYVWRTDITLAAYENLPTSMGDLPAVRIDGVSRRVARDGQIDPTNKDVRHYSMWFSDDADRVPLAIVAATDYGDLRMDIVEYVAGTGPRLGQ